jgi:hypothetical protein
LKNLENVEQKTVLCKYYFLESPHSRPHRTSRQSVSAAARRKWMSDHNIRQFALEMSI